MPASRNDYVEMKTERLVERLIDYRDELKRKEWLIPERIKQVLAEINNIEFELNSRTVDRLKEESALNRLIKTSSIT